MALQSTTALATVTLREDSLDLVFSGIPNTYKDLILISKVRSTRASADSDLFVQFNGDTGSNYSYIRMLARSSGVNSAVNINGTNYLDLGQVPGASSGSGEFAFSNCEILDYASTSKHKSTITRTSSAGTTDVVGAHAGRWSNASNAISSIRIFTNLGSITAGSIFSLYGRIA